MIPDVTPNGVFYLPPTGWLTSFYNPPFFYFEDKAGDKSNVNASRNGHQVRQRRQRVLAPSMLAEIP